MKPALITLLLMIFWNTSFSQNINVEIDSIVIVKSDDSGYNFTFTFSYEHFDTTNHDISRIREGLIDGHDFFGTDGSIPIKQIKDFKLVINNKNVEIGKNVYSKFFNPNIGYINGSKYVDAFWGDDYRSVYVFMNGSDGAGAYSVVWTLKENGEHTYTVNRDEVNFKFE